MTKTRLITFLIPLFLLHFFPEGKAQDGDKINVVFKGFKRLPGSFGDRYYGMIDEKMRSGLITLSKINLIVRDEKMLNTMAEELKYQDFIDPKTAMKFGNQLGAKYYIEGSIVQFLSLRDRSSLATYSTSLEASLHLVNLETGKYELVLTAKDSTVNADQDFAIRSVVNAVVTQLIAKLGREFSLKGQIQSADRADLIKINKGTEEGVKEQSWFRLADNENVKIKITSATAHESTGALVSGDLSRVKVGMDVIESTADSRKILEVTKKDKGISYLNGGMDKGIRKGDGFNYYVMKEVDIGTKVVYEEQLAAVLYVVDVRSDYSKAKVMKGWKSIDKGVMVTRSLEKVEPASVYLKLGYKQSFTANIKGNTPSGIVTVENSVGTFTVNSDSWANAKTLTDVKAFTVGLGSRNLISGFDVSYALDFYNAGEGTLKNFIFDLGLQYEHPLVHDRIYFVAGGAIGYGRLKQSNSPAYLISSGYSSYVKAKSIYGSVLTGIQFTYGRFFLQASASYDYLTFGTWKYDVKTETDRITETAPDAIIQYPKVDFGGLYINTTLAFRFSK